MVGLYNDVVWHLFLAALFLMRVLMFWCNLLDDFEEYLRKKMNDDNKYE